MITTRIALALTASLLALPAAAASWRDFPDVANTSYVEPGGDRALQLSISVPAKPQAVFDAFATSEGFSSWAVPMAKVDLRVGGMIEASYNPAAKIGDPNNIKNRIEAYVPGRLLVIHNVQAPADLPGREEFGRTVTIIELRPEGEGTRVILTNAGYGQGPGFDTAYSKFEWGDAYTLAELRNRFIKGPTDWAKAAEAERAQAASSQVTGAK